MRPGRRSWRRSRRSSEPRSTGRRDQPADDAGQGALHAGDDDQHAGSFEPRSAHRAGGGARPLRRRRADPRRSPVRPAETAASSATGRSDVPAHTTSTVPRPEGGGVTDLDNCARRVMKDSIGEHRPHGLPRGRRSRGSPGDCARDRRFSEQFPRFGPATSPGRTPLPASPGEAIDGDRFLQSRGSRRAPLGGRREAQLLRLRVRGFRRRTAARRARMADGVMSASCVDFVRNASLNSTFRGRVRPAEAAGSGAAESPL